MLSCFRNCSCFCNIKDSDGKQKGKNMEEIFIRGHAHPFYYHEQGRGSTYECNGCQQTGFGPYYSCSDQSCNFHYHKCCADFLKRDSPKTVPFGEYSPYPTGSKIFEERAPRKMWDCVACGNQVRGLRYKVRRQFQLRNYHAFHPLCASLSPRIPDPSGGQVTLDLEERLRGECPICKGKAKGWAYNSTCRKFCYHVGCVKNMIISSQQQDEASKNGENKKVLTIHVEMQLPQIQDIALVAIRLIIGALFGVPDVTGICIVPSKGL